MSTFENESFIDSELNINESIVSQLNNEEIMNSDLGAVEQTASELNLENPIDSILDEPLVHRYNGKGSDNIDVVVDNEKYEIIASLKRIRFNSVDDFPNVGSEKLIYIANDTKTLYGWDASKNEYFKLVAEVVIPTKLSEFQNDVGFINKNVSNLENYYTKNQTSF